MSTPQNAAYFESQLRPHLPSITDRNVRATLEDLLHQLNKSENSKTSTSKEEDKEAQPIKRPPRPDEQEEAKLIAKLLNGGLEIIEESAGVAVRSLVEELIAYVQRTMID